MELPQPLFTAASKVKIVLWLGMNCHFKFLILHKCIRSNINHEDFLWHTNTCKRNRMRFGANKLHKITRIFHGSLYQKHQVTIFYIQCCYNLCDWWYFTSMHKKHCKKHSCNHESSKLRFSSPGLARSFPMATHNFTISQIGSLIQ